MDRAEQVRQILSARGLTLYRVSQQSAQIFGRSSGYYVPHNLYHDVADPSLTPTIHQILALSHITNFRLFDWLAVFGFDLDSIAQLRLLIHKRRTLLLDSSVYDRYAWIPWFADRLVAGPVPSIAPLRQLLVTAAPKRAADLIALSKTKFLYARVGEEDVHALPDLAPGSVVRVDARRPMNVLTDTKANGEHRFFLVEHNLGWTCSQLVVLAKDRIMLQAPHRPCAQVELTLGKEARILGVIDAEIRPVARHRSVQVPMLPSLLTKPRLRHAPSPQVNLKGLLRGSRLLVGMSFREASSTSRRIADILSDQQYFAAPSTLSDYETLSEPPRHIQKIITLCLLYCIDFDQFLRASGMPLDQAGSEPIPDELVVRHVPRESRSLRAAGQETTLQGHNGFLSSLTMQWGEIPLFLRHSLSEISGLKNFSLSDVFWLGGDKSPLHPWLMNATFVVVNRRIKKPSQCTANGACEQRLFLVLKRDGSYVCGRCVLHEGKLVVHSYAGAPIGTQVFKNGADAEVVGQVTTIVRRLSETWE